MFVNDCDSQSRLLTPGWGALDMLHIPRLLCFVLTVLLGSTSGLQAHDLTSEERVAAERAAAERAIESVYHRRQINAAGPFAAAIDSRIAEISSGTTLGNR